MDKLTCSSDVEFSGNFYRIGNVAYLKGTFATTNGSTKDRSTTWANINSSISPSTILMTPCGAHTGSDYAVNLVAIDNNKIVHKAYGTLSQIRVSLSWVIDN